MSFHKYVNFNIVVNKGLIELLSLLHYKKVCDIFCCILKLNNFLFFYFSNSKTII